MPLTRDYTIKKTGCLEQWGHDPMVRLEDVPLLWSGIYAVDDPSGQCYRRISMPNHRSIQAARLD